ncbi:VOC family protein [Gordonia sp. Z-3]|jgi:predicted enzyme related to lactoylglutathione lyase|uniref:VOC family protein n=2 Tax=Gordonia TaxID=2053 RepID=A0A9X3I5S1_9ACTN|nr:MULTISPECIES: VOC family protein [Gordonia]MAU81509.1 glyoxalase [Gordonia sp. (in: high G+C Gram-positive bacteria)]MCF3938714.1 VOC family protein [Gordonia tangerina]MCX2965310.1 VOC family protein [Gordonia aquimaris]MED5802356.1 VOC family protein [Gordonia sp. Z-3]
MINGISIHSVYVLDQDAALDFYVGTLGFTVDTDVDMGFMRWLTVALPAQPDRLILLEKPSPPALSEQAAARVRELVALGAMPVTILSTDDCRGTYADLAAKGVEFTQEPMDQPYGIDCAFRDPFGNQLRMTQPPAQERPITDEDIARWAP